MSDPRARSLAPALVWLIASGLFGCQACGAPQRTEPVATDEGAHAAQGASEPPGAAAPGVALGAGEPTQPAPAPEAAPGLTLQTSVAAGSPTLTLTLTNDGDQTVQFASRLLLETSHGGTWRVDNSQGEHLARLDAQRALPDCAELVAGAELELAFTWAAGAPEAAEHRFVVTSCNGTGRLEGAPFTVSR